jgi:MATE family multidrug resistance protein
VITSVFIAAGKQGLASKFLVVFYWVIGLPLSGVLAFSYQLGLLGVWIGMLCAVGFHAIAYVVILLRLDWPLEANKAEKSVTVADFPKTTQTESSQAMLAPLLS